MTQSLKIVLRLIEEGTKARAHFQIWWVLRSLALPKYYWTMSDSSYIDFFHAANSGHYVLFLLALTKIFDRDSRVAGIRELKRALRAEGMATIALQIERELKPFEPCITKVMKIRNHSVVHNEHAISRSQVYKLNGITANQLRDIIDAACSSINTAARALGISEDIVFEDDRAERATLSLLEALEHGRT